VLRGYVRTWQNKIAEEFDRVGLLGLVAPLAPRAPAVAPGRSGKAGRER
jgi:hypothetical protein